ncbi:hypothetical protein [Mycobacterium riyadhense]|uniref:Uncharacterized protein n=1 Tax=Mycobacterium riyadhense TaxID=486698 RepID=A0A1X2BIW0_9MYCO|nr:hypothetical protein [Mycobacterium riyadhense]ORW63538.1 hypothetical protein AWC22_00480 [Mycobacterium riyadhense]
MTGQWHVWVTAAADRITEDTQAEIAEELRAGVTIDRDTSVLTASYIVEAATLRQAVDEALRAAGILPSEPTRLKVVRLDDWLADQAPEVRAWVG